MKASTFPRPIQSGFFPMSTQQGPGEPTQASYDQDRLVRENLGWLRGWIRGQVSDAELVHDLCQETFLKALSNISSLKDTTRFPAWLYRIAQNTLRDHLRRTRRMRRWFRVSGGPEEAEAVAAPQEDPGVARDAADVLEKIRSLPPRYRDPLLLLYSEDLSYAEIGKILNVSENTVQVRIFRARKMLRGLLGREGRGAASEP